MQQDTNTSREILLSFLDRWSIQQVESMTLDEYVSVGNKDTFCQWLETKTRDLGSIKGINSSKFGIYKRRDKGKQPKNLVNDPSYSWQSFYGKTKHEAFDNIKNEILKIIKYSEKGQFEEIDNLHLTLFVKWKIAYLYSNERLVPIFKKDILHKIAKSFGLLVNNKTKYSSIQELMIKHKPAHISIYEYAHVLYEQFGQPDNNERTKKEVTKTTHRNSSKSKNTTPQPRRSLSSYVAQQKHNILQNTLFSMLAEKYGASNVFLEENYVDIKVKLKNKIYFYEVKSSAYASDCIREALGQILSYYYADSDLRMKYLYVAGQYEPTDNEIGYINFIKQTIGIPFDYIAVPLNNS